MTIAAKHLDPLVGLDIHIILIPSPAGPIPTPLPHPYVGMVLDPFDYAPFIGATTYINGLPRGQAGTAGVALPPHIPMGGPFAKPPSNESELFMGSAIVCTEDEPQSFLGCMVLSCHDIGMPPPPRVKRKSPPKSMMLPTTVVLSIPMGMLVIIGGPPTISLMGMAFAGALKGLALLKKLGPIAKAIKKVSDKIQDLAGKLMKKLGLGDALRNKVHKAICSVTGHPVDIATGKVFTDRVDFEMPGSVPFRWERTWFSTSTYQGPLGHGWHHTYDQKLYIDDEVILYQTGDGRHVGLPHLNPGTEYFDRKERFTFFRDNAGYAIRTSAGHTHRFYPVKGRPANDVPLVEIGDSVGNKVVLRYDDWGRLTQIVDCAGRQVNIGYDQTGRIATLAAPHPDQPGQQVYVARYAYDAAGDLITVWDALGQPQVFEYRGHLLVREMDRNGLSFYFQWDAADETAKCTRTWGDGGIYDHKLSYDVVAKVTVVENSLGHKTTHHHDGAVVTKVINALGAVSETEYSDYHEIVAETDPLGNRTESKYDERGNVTERIAPDGTKVEFTYGPNDRVVSARDAIGGEWRWRHDEYGRLVERTNPLGETDRIEWHGANVAALIDPAANRTAFAYDPAGNLITVVTPDGAESHWSYDARGRIQSTTDPNGNRRQRVRDLKGRAVRVHQPDDGVLELWYDGEDNVVRTRDRQRDVAFAYQGMGRLTSRSEGGTTVHFEYDTEEQVTGIINEHGYVYRFLLDALGNVTEENGFDGLRRRYERDQAGRIVKVLRPDERSSTLNYDAVGRLVVIVHNDGTQERYAYRANGDMVRAVNSAAVVQFERDALGRVTKETQGADWVSSEYDVLGLRTSVGSSKGAFQRIQRNAMGDVLTIEAGIGPREDGGSRSTTVSTPSPSSAHGARSPKGAGQDPGTTFTAGFSRDFLGLEVDRSLPGGVRAKWHRDRLGRPTRHDVTQSEQPLTGRQFSWELNDRLKHVIDAMHGPVQYQHDALGNLVAAAYADGSVDLRMPDAVGNLFRTEARSDRKYSPSGQLLEARDAHGVTHFEYDPEGNLARKVDPDGGVWTYEWNGTGMLTRVERPDGRVVKFAYDALGRRVSKTYRDKTTRWIWDGNVPLHEWVERDSTYVERAASKVSSATADDAAIAARVREAVLVARPAQGPPPTIPTEDDRPDASLGTKDAPITWLFEPESFAPLGKLVGAECFGIVTDHLGAPTAMFDGAGNEVWGARIDSYGSLRDVRGERQACPFRWPGQYEDAETGLYYNRFRYYDPSQGQYLSPDPIGLAGGFNIYAYVRDPTSWIDPFGLTGIIYLRTDPVTGREYVGQARSPQHLAQRQAAHNRRGRRRTGNRGFTYAFTILESGVTPGTALDVAEENWIRAGGGPGALENGRYQMNDARYRAAGGCVPK